jgi:hypothetical protein
MKGLVVFGLLIYVNEQGGAGEEQKKNKKPNSHKILEQLYIEFPEYLFYVLHLSVMIILLLYLSLVMMSLRSIQCLREFYHLK